MPNTRLTDFEFDLFRRAPAKDNELCKIFRQKMQDETNDELAKTDMCLIEIDCQRLKRAMDCYNSFYSSLVEGDRAKIDLDENTTDDLEEICQNYA